MSKPVFAAAAERVNQRLETAGVYGFDIMVLIQLLPVLLQLFSQCKKPPTPTPIPVPTPTPAQSKAWDLKCTAKDGYDESDADYDRPLLHRTAGACRRSKRQGGDKCTRRESLELARASLDEARLGELDDIAQGIEESEAA